MLYSTVGRIYENYYLSGVDWISIIDILFVYGEGKDNQLELVIVFDVTPSVNAAKVWLIGSSKSHNKLMWSWI